MSIEISPKKQLYVGCALTHAPEDFRNNVEAVKEQLQDDWEVMRFLGLTKGSAADVYNQDISTNVRNCDAFLAIADHHATGLGWELGVADERHTPTLIVIKFGASVSRLVLGSAEARPHIQLRHYRSMDEIPEIVETHLRPMVK